MNEDDEGLLSAFRRFEQMGGIHFSEQNLHQWEEIDRFVAL